MIIRHSNKLFGERSTLVSTPSFDCVITTKKSGLFQGLSTVITEIDSDGKLKNGVKFLYCKTIPNRERLQMHFQIAEFISDHGEEGDSLFHALYVQGTMLENISIVQRVVKA